MKKNQMLSNLRNQRGVSAIVVAISIFMLIGFVALAIDIGHLYVVKNELQNSADAGALAGAAALYEATLGTAVDPYANQIAYYAATANNSEGVAVDLYNYTENSCPEPNPDPDPDPNRDKNDEYEDVRRGHWAFANLNPNNPAYKVEKSYFYCNNSLVALNVANYSTDQLNADNNFINAVKVVTRRSLKGTPALSFFARIFGYENFQMSAEAVAYIGFAAIDTEVGGPIALCEDTIKDPGSGKVSCNVGRMFNANNDTARWTNLDSPDNPTNASVIKSLVSCDENSEELILTEPEIGTVEGQVDVAFGIFHGCWENGSNEIPKNIYDEEDNMITEVVSIDRDDDSDNIPDQPWAMTLPVIDCTYSPTWGPVRSAVNVEVIWIAHKDDIEDAPQKMDYDIPTFDGNGVGPNHSTSWPDDDGFWATTEGPLMEQIHSENNPTGDQPSVYDIMTFFSENDPNSKQLLDKLDIDAQQKYPNPEGWDKDYPFWTTQKVNDFFDYGLVRWASLVKHFNLRDKDGGWACYIMKTIYFKPTCEVSEPTGHNGIQNFGILAKYPVLVK